MSRLLHARFVLVRKDPLVRVAIVFLFLLGIFLVGIACHIGIKENQVMYLDDIIYIDLPIICLMCAVVCSYLSAQEYCDGAIRNKLIAGHTRVAIYLSNFIINVIVVFCFWLVAFLTEIALGWLLLDGLQTDVSKLFTTCLGILLAIMALCAIFTMVAMSCQNNRTSDAVCLLLACILLFSSMFLMMVMDQLKDYDALAEDGADGIVYTVDKDDELYPIIQHRETYEFLYDFLPTGQIIQYICRNVKRPQRLPLCSAGIIVVTTSFGALIFRKKNIQ